MRDLYPWIERPGREAEHSSLSSVKVKNVEVCSVFQFHKTYSTSPSTPPRPAMAPKYEMLDTKPVRSVRRTSATLTFSYGIKCFPCPALRLQETNFTVVNLNTWDGKCHV